MRSHTKSFLYAGGCLVCCSEGVISLVSPDGALPRGVFALLDLWTVPEMVVAALGLGAVSALPETEVAFFASPHLLVVPWTRFRPGRQPPPVKALLHFASTVPLHQGDGHACWPGRFRTVSPCAVHCASCRASTTGAVIWYKHSLGFCVSLFVSVSY